MPTLAELAQTTAATVAVVTLFFTLVSYWWENRRRQREAQRIAQETLETRQIEIYQRLEIESNDVFRYEAEHYNILPLFKSHLVPPGIFASDTITDLNGQPISAHQAKLVVRKYYELCCNLFEIAARLRDKNIIEPEVFGSWVAWYFDTATEWAFRAVWHDLRDNYTKHLRNDIFDDLTARLIREWDKPHARGLPLPVESADEPLSVHDDTLAQIRADFYESVGARFDCETIRGWLEGCKMDERVHDHPASFR